MQLCLYLITFAFVNLVPIKLEEWLRLSIKIKSFLLASADITPKFAKNPLPNTMHASVFFISLKLLSNLLYRGLLPVISLDAPEPVPNFIVAFCAASISLLSVLNDK